MDLKDSEPDPKTPPSRRRTMGWTMRAPGVEVHLEQETVGQLSERYVSDEVRSERRFDFFKLISFLLGVIVALGTLLKDSHLFGGNAISIAAGVVGAGVLSAALLIADSIKERSLPNEPQVLTQNLNSLKEGLTAMRRPLLERSSADENPST